uniref:Reverse transcriptase domain-containing protein n=1 Tax=Tanacetum cinerariifolium TaxID=118510 RepID=A0A699HB63_TANCI|nr:reverse transcriptase domain-containing protein [Tanacetum cinerariifolium]
MHTRASNSELVEPLPKPERTLNPRRRLRNKTVPYDQRNNPPQQPRIVYPPILDINHFHHFLVTLENLYPMVDEPMWAIDRVVTPTPGFAIIIPETANEFSIKGNHLTLVKGNQFDGRTKTHTHKYIYEFLRIFDMFKYRDTKNEAVRLMMFPLSLTGEAKTWLDELNEGTIKTWDELRTAFISRFFPPALFNRLLEEIRAFSQYENEFLTDAWLHAMTLKMDAQYNELQTHAKKTKPDLNKDDIPMSREKEAKFMQTFRKTRFYNNYRDCDSNRDNWRLNERSSNNRDNYGSNTHDKPYDLQKLFNDFMKSQQSTNAFVKETFMDLKTQLETRPGRPSGSLPRNTQPNPKGHSSKAYQPPQSRNENVNAIFTRSGKSYNLPVNPNDQHSDSENPINFDGGEEDEEPTPQPKTKNPKPVRETLLPKPYKQKIMYPQRLRKEKMEAQYEKFLDMICVVQINVPLIDVLAGFPNHGKFLKELISNKHKIEQISAAFLSDESSTMIQNKVPLKLGDPESFLIPCNFNKTFSCNALADLGVSINLMPYSLYAKLSLKTLKPTKISVRLADRSFQYPLGIAKNMLVEVAKFTFPVDFVILEMEEFSKVPLILR